MRVLVVGEQIDRSEAALLTGLRAAGFDIEIMADPHAPPHEALRPGAIPVTDLSVAGRIDPCAIRAIRERCATRQPDIIHTLTGRTLSNVLLATRGRRVKHVAYRGTMGHLSRFDPSSRLTFLNPRIDRIICVSEAVRSFLLSIRVPASRLTRIYKGHDPDWYTCHSKPLLTEFGIPAGAFVVAFAGGIRPLKGVDVLLRSALRLAPDSSIHYLLVGQVRDRRVARLARDRRIADRVHLPGFRANANQLVGACSIFVMPSVRREGLPRAVIEAMSQGVPAIVSDVGGMPEIVIDRDCGLVIPAGNERALADAICTLADDRTLRERYGRKARARIAEHFGIQATIQQTAELYREVAVS